MSIKHRLKKLEALPVHANISMANMAEISTDQAEKIYKQVMNEQSLPLFARTQKGAISINDLSEQELGQIYKKYADGNFEIITEQEV